jgi:hypothetical protein
MWGGEQGASLAVQLPSTMMAVLKISRDVLSMFISLSRLHTPRRGHRVRGLHQRAHRLCHGVQRSPLMDTLLNTARCEPSCVVLNSILPRATRAGRLPIWPGVAARGDQRKADARGRGQAHRTAYAYPTLTPALAPPPLGAAGTACTTQTPASYIPAVGAQGPHPPSPTRNAEFSRNLCNLSQTDL